MKAFGYVRQSKGDQGTSPKSQRQAIESLCKARGWTLVEVFEDLNVSAYNGKRRPQFERMLSRLGEVDAVVFLRLDRLARNLSHLLKLGEEFERAGVQLVAVDGDVDTTSATGRAFYQMRGVFADFESRSLSERVKRMVAHKQAQGEWFGQAPFGWRYDRTTRKLVSVPEQQAVIRQAAERYIAGESLRRIAPSLGHTHANLARILRSDRVMEALPPELSRRLAQELAERGRIGTSATPSLLGGVARCGVCGAPMTIVAAGGWQDGVRVRQPRGSYACRERGHVTISRRWLDQRISGEVLSAIDPKRLAKRMARRKRQRPKVMQAAEVEARLELLQQDFYDRGAMPRERFLRMEEGLLRKLAEAREAQAEANSGPDIPLELAKRLPEVWPKLNTMEQRRIVRALVREIQIAKAQGTGPINPNRVSIAWR
jgi:site-specific DNA recombinase